MDYILYSRFNTESNEIFLRGERSTALITAIRLNQLCHLFDPTVTRKDGTYNASAIFFRLTRVLLKCPLQEVHTIILLVLLFFNSILEKVG